MSLKMKLVSTISAFMLILGLLIMGVFASPTAEIRLGGKISFTATDVNAKVRATISGTADETQPTLPELEYKAGATAEELTTLEGKEAEWADCVIRGGKWRKKWGHLTFVVGRGG